MHARTILPFLTTCGLLAGVAATSGCAYDDGLLIQNLYGTVAIPVEAATRTFVRTDDEGNVIDEEVITDVRNIGPVYLGLYPSVLPANTIESYPHPEIGPQYQVGVQGDTYPYGGTTVGDVKYACFEYLTCKVSSGRYATFDELADWFANVLESPITDAAGKEITDGELIRQVCFDLLEVTADYEIAVATGDRNDDGVADALDLDFQLSDDGQFYEADFTIWQQEWFWDQNQENCTPGEDCTGFTLWGFVDSPDVQTNLFTTCNPSAGYEEDTYNNDFQGGKAYPDVLNQPSQYITRGDWVATEGYVWKDIYDQPRLELGFEVTQ